MNVEPASAAAFFRLRGELLVPRPSAAAPWAENMLHGRMLSALAARAVDRDYGDPGFHCSRLTIDLFRAATLAPVTLTTKPVREGGRLRVVDVEIESEGKAVGRATALLLRYGEQPAVSPWRAPEWAVPRPEELIREDTPESRFIPIETRSVVPGGYRAAGRKRIWLRELCPLVEREDWTPLPRIAAVADLTNALANSDEQPNHFINADVTIYLGRLPDGEWIGLDTSGHVSARGVAVASCDLYDVSGRCGTATVSALAAPAPLKLPDEQPEQQ